MAVAPRTCQGRTGFVTCRPLEGKKSPMVKLVWEILDETKLNYFHYVWSHKYANMSSNSPKGGITCFPGRFDHKPFFFKEVFSGTSVFLELILEMLIFCAGGCWGEVGYRNVLPSPMHGYLFMALWCKSPFTPLATGPGGQRLSLVHVGSPVASLGPHLFRWFDWTFFSVPCTGNEICYYYTHFTDEETETLGG